MNSQNEPTGTVPHASRTVYPSFYAVVHEAANAEGFMCQGEPEPYEPDEHDCFALAGNLRVSLHAAGIMLSSDRQPTDDDRWHERMRSLGIPIDEFERNVGLPPGTLDRRTWAEQAADELAQRYRLDRTNSRRVGPDPEDREPFIIAADTLEAAEVAIFGPEEAMRRRLADAESALYDGQDGDEDDDPGNDTRTGFRALVGRLMGPWKVF